ncbi:MAG: NusG domain II-containing protein [Turicibacter sp.]
MKRLDLYIILFVIAITGIMFTTFTLNQSDETKAIIYVKGEKYETVVLDGKDQVFEIETELGYNKIIIDEHGIHVEEADCPDHECVTLGTINKVGQSIICAPNYVVVEIVGNDADSEMDSMAI